MVSDIVVLKELPDFVKESIGAYVGCLSGAMKKTEYLNAIKSAGFTEVKIVETTSFPLDCLINDPTAKVIMDDLKVTPEQVQNLSASIASIKVSGTK